MEERASHTELRCFVGITAAFVVGLHQLGAIEGLAIDWSNPAEWIDRSAAENVVGATLRAIGLVVGYWLLATTTLFAITAVRGRHRRPRWVSIVTLPGIRRMVDRTLATALAASIVVTPMSPALAYSETVAPPAVVAFDASDGIPVPHVTSPATTAVTESGEDESPVSVPTMRPVLTNPTPVMAEGAQSAVAAVVVGELPRSYTVTRGDNLWSIAAGHVGTVLDSEPAPGIVTEYWRRLVEANRDTLRSGDPNLIYPGELIGLPDFGAVD